MARNASKSDILALLGRLDRPVSLPELLDHIDHSVPERTLRRWLSQWVDEGILARTGNRRSTRYHLTPSDAKPAFKFLEGLSTARKTALLQQLRDLWTHTSTAIEGNTLTLGDTHVVLEHGLTVSGKPLKDHREVIGHARAIEILYATLNRPTTEDTIFALHKVVQTDVVTDIYKPNGAWKVEPNGSYVVTRDNQQVYVNYADPQDVPQLMREVIMSINATSQPPMTLDTAHRTFAKIHAGVAHVHPFWDGNGRIARLLANVPLLRAGLPPIMIPNTERPTYIQLLAEYELAVGQINEETGVWPDSARLADFEAFCGQCYDTTRRLVEQAHRA